MLAEALASAPAGAGEARGSGGQPGGEGRPEGGPGGIAGRAGPRPPRRPHFSLLPVGPPFQVLPTPISLHHRFGDLRVLSRQFRRRDSAGRSSLPSRGPLQLHDPTSSLTQLLLAP